MLRSVSRPTAIVGAHLILWRICSCRRNLAYVTSRFHHPITPVFLNEPQQLDANIVWYSFCVLRGVRDWDSRYIIISPPSAKRQH